MLLALVAAVMIQLPSVTVTGLRHPRPVPPGPEGSSPPFAYYPEEARAAGVGGKATVSCHLQADRTLTACKATDEQPTGMGFGEHAVTLATMMAKNHPVQVDQYQTDGREVVGVMIPFLFKLAPEGGPRPN